MASAGADHAARRALRAGATLALVVAVLCLGLSLLERAARPLIDHQERVRRLGPVHELLSQERYDNDLLEDRLLVRDTDLFGTDEPVAVYRARRNGAPVAVFMIITAPTGYGGAIRLLVGIEPDGRLLGVRALSHRETPGLGDAIDTGRSDWILAFNGRSLGNPPFERWTVRRDGGDFDQFTGATVTSRAVTTAVRNALVYFGRHRQALLAPAG